MPRSPWPTSFKFGFKVEAVGTDGGPTLAEAFTPVVDQAKTDIEKLGALAMAVFERVAGAGGDAKGWFSADAFAGCGKAIGRDVRADEVQSVLNELMEAPTS